MLLDQIQTDIASAMKVRDQAKVDCLRFLVGAAFNLAIEKGKDYQLTDSDVLAVITKQVKTHKESIGMFEQAKRADLVAKEQAELTILQGYLPAQLTEEEVRNKIKEIVSSHQGADFGTIMKLAMAELKGKADGAMVAEIIKNG